MGEPLPICYLNGELIALRDARISPLDRCFLFGDGVYEVIAAPAGQARSLDANLSRLAESLRQLRIRDPHSGDEWRAIVQRLIDANGGGDLYVYLQVSRGAEWGRNHAPLPQIAPTVFAFCAPLPRPSSEQIERGLSCITATDIRWARCNIKAVALLANVLLRQQALDAGADEAILLKDGWLTEASASSVYVVHSGTIHVPPNGPGLLPGTTRVLLEQLAHTNGIPLRRAAVDESQLRSADEIWLSAATRGVMPVTRLDGAPVGAGRPGPLWHRMQRLVEESRRD